jgi:ring-1,2-phenylacetyl-CoA epoxidase subunit PaaE
MMDAVEASLLAHGVAGDRILIERFTTKPLSDEQRDAVAGLQARATGLKMSVTLNGRRTVVTFDPGRTSILDQVRAAGLPAPYSCKGGVCATCRARVTAGRAEMTVNYGLSPQEVAQGYILTCQSTPIGEGLALSYDV